MNYSIILPCCDYNSWCVAPYLRLHEKFWGDDITVVAPQNYTQHKHFQLVPSRYNVRQNFSFQLIDALIHTKHDNVVVMLADYFLYQPVNLTSLNNISEYMTQNPNIIRVDVGGQSCNGPVEEVSPQLFSGSKFQQVSLTPGMWNKKLWIDMLQSRFGMDPWMTETELEQKFLRSSYSSLLARPQPVYYVNTLRGRDDRELVTRRNLYLLIQDLIPTRFKISYED